MDEPLGALQAVSTVEDRTLYAYHPKKRTLRGVVWVVLALGLAAAAIVFGLREQSWLAYLYAIVLAVAASAAGYCGMIDLLNRPLFQIEVDRRARTIALAIPKEAGQAPLRIKFEDVHTVRITEKGPPPIWIVTLSLKNGRRIGLGASDQQTQSDDVAKRFAELIGVEIVRTKS